MCSFTLDKIGAINFGSPCWAYTSPRSMTTKALKQVKTAAGGQTLRLEMPVWGLDELQEMREKVDLYKGRLTEVCMGSYLSGQEQLVAASMRYVYVYACIVLLLCNLEA